ncbi:hypothetical protein D3C80_2013210 [compost metagenome]
MTTLGLPNRISSFDVDKSQLAKVAGLLKSNYPKEVDDLGNNASAKLDMLLESLW